MTEYPSLASSQAEKQVIVGDDTTKQVCPEPGLQYIEVGRLETVVDHCPHRKTLKLRSKQGTTICSVRRRTVNIVCLLCTLLLIGIGAASGVGVAVTQGRRSNASRPTSIHTTNEQIMTPNSPSSSSSSISSTLFNISSSSSVLVTRLTTSSSVVLSTLATSTTTSTSSLLTSAAYNCPSDTNTTYIPPNTTLVFQKVCDTDWRKGDPGIKGGLVADTGNFLVYTIEECIDICANLPARRCSAVCYWGNITLAVSQGFEGNCWLKNQRAVQSWTSDWQQEGAYLVQG